MGYESWETLQKVFCAKSSDFTRDQLKLVPWCDYDNYYMLTDEINEFLEIYLDNVKGVDLDMESFTEEFNLFTVYIVFRKFWLENC